MNEFVKLQKDAGNDEENGVGLPVCAGGWMGKAQVRGNGVYMPMGVVILIR